MNLGLRRLAVAAAAAAAVLSVSSPARADIGLTLGLGGGYVGYFVTEPGSVDLINGFGVGLDVDLVLSPNIVVAFYGEVTRNELPRIGSQRRGLIGAYLDARFRVNILTKRVVPYLAAGAGAWTSFLVLGDMSNSSTLGERSSIALNFPLSIGLEFRLHKYFSLGLEATYHLLLGQGLGFDSVGDRNDFDVWTAGGRIRIHFGVPNHDKLYGEKYDEEEKTEIHIKRPSSGTTTTPASTTPVDAHPVEEPPPPPPEPDDPPAEDDTPPESGPSE